MSTNSVQTALFVGPHTATTEKLKVSFTKEGLHAIENDYSEITADFLTETQPAIVILNTVFNKAAATQLLNTLRTRNLHKNFAVMALVHNIQDEMQAVLSLGAADFFTEEEDVASIKLKANNLMGESNNFAGSTVVDISEPAPILSASDGVRVFVVEDDTLLKNLLSLKLEQSKFPAEFSIDGVDIIPKLKVFKPQVIVLDIMLPGKTGLDILAEIKAEPGLQETPVIMFSNRDEQADRNRAAELGAAGFYVKAMTDLSDLVVIIDKLAH